jgi:hypothetical protein
MRETEWHAAYLGGHPRFVVKREPVPGVLRLSADRLTFLVQGEFLDALFEAPWDHVTSWDVEGTNTSTKDTSAGRAAVGALLAGAAGAIVGLAATKERFASVLALEIGDATIGFLVRDVPPTAIVAELRSIEHMARVYQSASAPRPARWEYVTSSLDDLKALGQEGWEAVGVWTDAAEPQVLMKRLLP